MTTCFRAQEVYTSVTAYTSRVLEQGNLTDRIELCFLCAYVCIERDVCAHTRVDGPVVDYLKSTSVFVYFITRSLEAVRGTRCGVRFFEGRQRVGPMVSPSSRGA